MNWDNYFYDVCVIIAKKSPCLSRKIGALIVDENNIIISTGFNGPPSGVPHCGTERYFKDDYLNSQIKTANNLTMINDTCPRKILAFKSGEGMHLCTAQHAEQNAVTNAAINGVKVQNCTLYLNAPIPCNKCFGILINLRIKEIVAESIDLYDKQTEFFINKSNIKIRKFNLHA